MGRIRALDGLRGLAVLSVVVSHFVGLPRHGLQLFDIGWMGVDVFFVLSGFLIGSIILAERDQPGFVWRFYARRAARILPAYWLTLLFAYLVVAPLVPGSTPARMYQPFTYLSFSQNIVTAFNPHRDVLWTSPFWTLGIEEQFYLVLPLVMMLTPRRWMLLALVAIWGGSALFRSWGFFSGADPSDALFLLPGRADLLVAGVIGAWLNERGVGDRGMTALRLAPAISLVGGAATCLSGVRAFADFSECFFSLGVAAFIVALVNGAPEARSLMESRVLVYFGRISYGLYLIHLPISCALQYGLLGSPPDVVTPAQIGLTVLAAVLSVAAAAASWRWLEKPLIDHARQWLGASARPILAT